MEKVPQDREQAKSKIVTNSCKQ